MPLPFGFATTYDHVRIELELGSGRMIPLRFGKADKECGPSEMKPGFLEYSVEEGGIPTDDEREAILTALSFILGRQLARIGTTTYDRQWQPIAGQSRRAYLVGHVEALEGIGKPPALLTMKDGIHVDERRLGTAVSALVRADFLNLGPALWTLWVGQRGLLDNATGLYGAALEAVRSSYFESIAPAATLLLPAEHFKLVRRALEEALDAMAPNGAGAASQVGESFRILRNKLGQLNNRSSNMLYPEFFERLGLPAYTKESVEASALKARNGPAHGRRYKNEEYPALVQTANALLTVFHRCVLKAAAATDSYVDYSTDGWPSRELEHPLGGPNGDGVPADPN